MRAGFDVTPLRLTHAGTARHARGLLAVLRERGDVELELLEHRRTGRLASLWRDGVWYPFRLGRAAAGLDVLHCTTLRGPRSAPCPVVVTVHDLALLRHPEAFPAWHRVSGRAALRRTVPRATAVVAVSEFTRAEAIELLELPPERVHVVPNGVDAVFHAGGDAAPGDFALAVGTLEPRKNLQRAVDAARLAKIDLRVVGARGWGGVEVPRWQGACSDEELATLYRGASCLVYPSLYEGFGLPVLEAMACGTPVVTSRGGATEEVAGGAAVLVDPLDPAAIAAGIREAIDRRAELAQLGRARAARFTWERAADLLVTLWRELR